MVSCCTGHAVPNIKSRRMKSLAILPSSSGLRQSTGQQPTINSQDGISALYCALEREPASEIHAMAGGCVVSTALTPVRGFETSGSHHAETEWSLSS